MRQIVSPVRMQGNNVQVVQCAKNCR